MSFLQVSDNEVIKIIKIQVRELNLAAKDLYKTFFKKHGEILEKTRLRLNQSEPIQWSNLNTHLENYSADRSWATTQFWQATKMKKDLARDYKSWYNSKLLYCRDSLKKKPSEKSPPQYLIEAEMERLFKRQVNYWKVKNDDVELLVGFYQDLKDVWKDQINVYQTLSSNMRSEFPYLKNT